MHYIQRSCQERQPQVGPRPRSAVHRGSSLAFSTMRTAELGGNFTSVDYASLRQVDAAWNYRVHATKYSREDRIFSRAPVFSSGTAPLVFRRGCSREYRANVSVRRMPGFDFGYAYRTTRSEDTHARIHASEYIESRAELEAVCSPVKSGRKVFRRSNWLNFSMGQPPRGKLVRNFLWCRREWRESDKANGLVKMGRARPRM